VVGAVVVEEEECCTEEKWGTAAGQEVVVETVQPAAALEWVVEVANLSEVAVVVQEYYFCSRTENVEYCDLRVGWG
jgi:hypothetical protein